MTKKEMASRIKEKWEREFIQIDSVVYDGRIYYLFEHIIYGEYRPCILTDQDYNYICDTYDDIYTTLDNIDDYI